jgi:hypothetical protein
VLILKPGELTREFIAGRHQNYLPPFRLYLAISILFFALSALLPDKDLVHFDGDGQAVTAPVTNKPAEPAASAARHEQLAALAKDCHINLSLPLIGPVGEPLSRACKKVAADSGVRLFERFTATAPRLMFLFLPLMAAVALLFYWRRPRRLYAEHLVLFLHNHAFTFLLIAGTVALNALSSIDLPLFGLFGFLEFLLFVFLPYYVFRSMRVVYGEGRLRTLLKFTALGTIYFVLLAVTMLAGFVYTALALA